MGRLNWEEVTIWRSRVQFIVVNISFGKSGWYFWFWNVSQFFFFQRFWKSFHKFPKVAKCHVLAHLVDVFVTEIGKKIVFGNPLPKKKNVSTKIFFDRCFFARSSNFLKNGPILMIFFFRHMFSRVLITNLMSEMLNSN